MTYYGGYGETKPFPHAELLGAPELSADVRTLIETRYAAALVGMFGSVNGLAEFKEGSEQAALAADEAVRGYTLKPAASFGPLTVSERRWAFPPNRQPEEPYFVTLSQAHRVTWQQRLFVENLIRDVLESKLGRPRDVVVGQYVDNCKCEQWESNQRNGTQPDPHFPRHVAKAFREAYSAAEEAGRQALGASTIQAARVPASKKLPASTAMRGSRSFSAPIGSPPSCTRSICFDRSRRSITRPRSLVASVSSEWNEMLP